MLVIVVGFWEYVWVSAERSPSPDGRRYRTLVCVIGALIACDRESPPRQSESTAVAMPNASSPHSQLVIRAELKDGPANQVIADQQQVTLQMASGARETMQWSDVRRISIITTDEGPRRTDVFFVLQGLKSSLVLPHGANGDDGFVALLVSINGIDHRTFVEAMGSGENAEFVCWTGATVSFRDPR